MLDVETLSSTEIPDFGGATWLCSKRLDRCSRRFFSSGEFASAVELA
jgi:hypothetical protein